MEIETSELDGLFKSASRYFALLSDQNRVRIIHALCGQERSVSDLVTQTGATQANLSRHLRTLYDAGVIKRRKAGHYTYYRITDPSLADICRIAFVQIVGRNERPASNRIDALALVRDFEKAAHASDKPN